MRCAFLTWSVWYPSVVSWTVNLFAPVRWVEFGVMMAASTSKAASVTRQLIPLAVTITAANVHDLNGGKKSLTRVSRFIGGRKLKKIYADGAYAAESFRL